MPKAKRHHSRTNIAKGTGAKAESATHKAGIESDFLEWHALWGSPKK